MMKRVELNEKMMAQVNGGIINTSAVNPYSPWAPERRKGERNTNDAK